MRRMFHVTGVTKKYRLDDVLVAEGRNIKDAVVDSRLPVMPIEESLKSEHVFVGTEDSLEGGIGIEIKLSSETPSPALERLTTFSKTLWRSRLKRPRAGH